MNEDRIGESNTPLENRDDVKRALATHIRRLQGGSVDVSMGQVITTALATLAKMFDTDDELRLKARIKAIEDRQKQLAQMGVQ